MNKKSEYAKQVKERNKELIKTKPKSLNTSKAESLINSTTNSMTNLTEQVAIIDQKYGKDQKASWKPPGAPKVYFFYFLLKTTIRLFSLKPRYICHNLLQTYF